ncbi:MAG: GIY-YIG nuclease family protein [Pseudomonadota bacterium]
MQKVDRNWEAKFDADMFDDYKESWVEQERLRQQNSTICWIYIGIDTQRSGEIKVGKTTGELGTRASSTQNPYYTVFHAFKIKHQSTAATIASIEASVFDMLDKKYVRIKHWGSSKPSEWFKVKPGASEWLTPETLTDLIEIFLYELHSSHMYCYYCVTRGRGVIHGWRNPLIKGNVPSYQATDLSSPPVSIECLMPGGCGDENCHCFK